MSGHAPHPSGAHESSGALRHLFGQVAFWQGMGFLAMVAFIWARESLDLPNLLLDEPPSPPDWIGAAILTVGILAIGFVITAHTYLQQKRVLKGYIRVCSYCRKVHIEDTSWEQMEQFISDRTLAEFTHGICPTCLRKAEAEIEASVREKPTSAPGPGS